MNNPEQTLKYDQLDAAIYQNEKTLGQAAAAKFTADVNTTIAEKGNANVIIATGNSQLAFFSALRERSDIDWSKVNVFHMDEYVGMGETHSASFRGFAKREIVKPLRAKAFFGIEGDAEYPEQAAKDYAALLAQHPPDVCCMGIGENGHIAFNDPPYADFNDSEMVKIVDLDEVSRKQQVGEGHFASLEETPKSAISLTIPMLLQAPSLIVIVPEKRKAEAVKRALEGDISENCPASILRTAPKATLFLDRASASTLVHFNGTN